MLDRVLRRSRQFAAGALAGTVLLACPVEPDPPDEHEWQVLTSALPGALLSVWGRSTHDVWAVGADALDGTGPTVLHFDGETWERLETGQAQGNLWWVFGFEEGPIYMGGEGGLILRYVDGDFTVMSTPSTGTVYGIWGAREDEVWAVGGNSAAMGGFAWRLVGDEWVEEASLPADVPAEAALWKAFGTDPDDAWFVGSSGVALHWDGTGFERAETGVGASLFTVHASGDRYAAVGGTVTGIIVEYADGTWSNVTPDDPPPAGLSGVTLGEGEFGIAVGAYGEVLVRSADGWAAEDIGVNIPVTLHGSWVDGEGGAWVVGGRISAPPFDQGVLLHRGGAITSEGL